MKHLAAAVVANRRMLKLLDQQIDELSKIEPGVAADLTDPDRHQPFSYVVAGVDGRAGIVMEGAAAGSGGQSPQFGYIRIESDAAFVATRAFCCEQTINLLAGTPSGFAFDATTWDLFFGLSLRAYDEGSQRWLFMANQRQFIQATAVPSSLFGALPITSEGGIELPAECVFPRNGLVRIEAYQQHSAGGGQRIYFILHGYKVFGG